MFFKYLRKRLSYLVPKNWGIIPTETKNWSSLNSFQDPYIETYKSALQVAQYVLQFYWFSLSLLNYVPCVL